jgi:hypothetical protein
MYADGRFFGVFDGHCGAEASTLCRGALAKNFYKALSDSTTVLGSMHEGYRNQSPMAVGALDQAFHDTQRAMPDAPKNTSGCTAIACWLEDDKKPDQPLTVYAACCGDSQAIMFDSITGRIPAKKCRLWDSEMGTMHTAGENAMLPYETTAHALTGALKENSQGKKVGMSNDTTGVGFREYKLLMRKHKSIATRVPRCLSNMCVLKMSTCSD